MKKKNPRTRYKPSLLNKVIQGGTSDENDCVLEYENQ